MNEIIGRYVTDFNMFYLSRNATTELLILRKLQPYIPYTIFLLGYLLGFSFCAYSSFFVETWIYKKWLKYKPEPLNDLETKID